MRLKAARWIVSGALVITLVRLAQAVVTGDHASWSTPLSVFLMGGFLMAVRFYPGRYIFFFRLLCFLLMPALLVNLFDPGMILRPHYILYFSILPPFLTLLDSPRSGWITALLGFGSIAAVVYKSSNHVEHLYIVTFYLVFALVIIQAFAAGAWNIISELSSQNESVKSRLRDSLQEQEMLFELLSRQIQLPLEKLATAIRGLVVGQKVTRPAMEIADQSADEIRTLLDSARRRESTAITADFPGKRFEQGRQQMGKRLLFLTFGLGLIFSNAVLGRDLFFLHRSPTVAIGMMIFMLAMIIIVKRMQRPGLGLVLVVLVGLYGGTIAGYVKHGEVLGIAPLVMMIPATLIASFLLPPRLFAVFFAGSIVYLVRVEMQLEQGLPNFSQDLLTAVVCSALVGSVFHYFERRFSRDQLKGVDDIEKSFSSVDSLRSTLGHDLVSPLMVVQGHLEIASSGGLELDAGTRAMLLKQLARIQDVSRFVGLIFAAGGDTGVLKAQTTSVNHLLDQVRENYDFFAVQKNIKLEILNLEHDTNVSVHTDAFVSSILGNLVTNGIKFCSQDGVLKIEASLEDNHMVAFKVTNQGPGLAQNILEAVNAGKRVESMPGTAGETGTGQGLHLVHTYLTAVHGRMLVQNTAGGVQASIYLRRL